MVKITKEERKRYKFLNEKFCNVEENILSSIWLGENFPNDPKQEIIVLIKAFQNFAFLVQNYENKDSLNKDSFDIEGIKDAVDTIFKNALKYKEYKYWCNNYQKFFNLKDEFCNNKELPSDTEEFVRKFQIILTNSLNYLIKNIKHTYHYDFWSLFKRNFKYILLFFLIIFGFWYHSKSVKYQTYNFLNWKEFDADWQHTLISQDWGNLHVGYSVDDNICSIDGKKYLNCYGTHAKSKIKLTFKPIYKQFEGICGKDDECGYGSVKCKVLDKNEQVLFQSGILDSKHKSAKFSVNIEGSDTLYLVYEDGGNGISCAHADWLDLKILK